MYAREVTVAKTVCLCLKEIKLGWRLRNRSVTPNGVEYLEIIDS